MVVEITLALSLGAAAVWAILVDPCDIRCFTDQCDARLRSEDMSTWLRLGTRPGTRRIGTEGLGRTRTTNLLERERAAAAIITGTTAPPALNLDLIELARRQAASRVTALREAKRAQAARHEAELNAQEKRAGHLRIKAPLPAGRGSGKAAALPSRPSANLLASSEARRGGGDEVTASSLEPASTPLKGSHARGPRLLTPQSRDHSSHQRWSDSSASPPPHPQLLPPPQPTAGSGPRGRPTASTPSSQPSSPNTRTSSTRPVVMSWSVRRNAFMEAPQAATTQLWDESLAT